MDMDCIDNGEFKSSNFDKVFCTIEIKKDGDFEVEEFWIVRKAIMDFVDNVACPMMLMPSFPPKDIQTFRLMFETYKNAVDIIESFFHTEDRLKDLYVINIKFDDINKQNQSD